VDLGLNLQSSVDRLNSVVMRDFVVVIVEEEQLPSK
jgi:hypothetical protein